MDPRRLLPALAAVACACVVATLVVSLVPQRDAQPVAPGHPPESPRLSVASPADVLARWDERRAAAWADADVRALRELYADGSRTGAADVRLLRRYRARGLAVRGLTTQVLALEVVDRAPSRLVLEVTDRVVGGRAVGGPTPVALPVGRASTRRVVLVRDGGRWRVVEARDQASAAARTLRTSSSAKS